MEQPTVSIPDSYKDLLTEPVHAVLVTMMPDGQPQAQVVWADLEGDHIMINTEASRQKARNMENNPRVTLVFVDPKDPNRFIEIRGVVDSMSEADGVEKINYLSQKYEGQPYFGGRTGEEQRLIQRRVTVRVRPTRIVTHE
jgi:PPOX class probable F420-dependent enzyme